MNCEGCVAKGTCFFIDPPYYKGDVTVKKFDASSCPCQHCLVKSICTEKCISYKILEGVMHEYYTMRWEEKEEKHKEKIRKMNMEAQCPMFRVRSA